MTHTQRGLQVQGEYLSPLLFAMYANDYEVELAVNGIEGKEVSILAC